MNSRTLPSFNASSINVRSVVAHPLAQAIAIELFAYLLFVYGLPFVAGVATGNPAPTPASILTLYMGMVTAVVLVYVSSNEATWRQFKQPILTVATERERRSVVLIRRAILILLPLLAGYQTYAGLQTSVQPPAELRSIHPAPPTICTALEVFPPDNPWNQIVTDWPLHPNSKNLVAGIGLNKPLRGDTANFDKNVQAGAATYASHWVFCHGDAQNGQGIFAQGLNPSPANFTDPGTIAQLQEGYLFWRVAKGGPGLPSESAPWNSGMPAWEDALDDTQIWQVIMYLYQATGYKPRTWE